MSSIDTAEAKLKAHGNEEAAITLESFESRWRYAIFPAMLAFFILSAFGFYLIYGILQRMADLSEDVNRMTDLMQQRMPELQRNVSGLSQQMSDSMPQLEQHVNDMQTGTASMAQSTQSMTNSIHGMDQTMWHMNKNISKPMQVFDKVPAPYTPPPQLPPGYYGYPTYAYPPAQMQAPTPGWQP